MRFLEAPMDRSYGRSRAAPLFCSPRRLRRALSALSHLVGWAL